MVLYDDDILLGHLAFSIEEDCDSVVQFWAQSKGAFVPMQVLCASPGVLQKCHKVTLLREGGKCTGVCQPPQTNTGTREPVNCAGQSGRGHSRGGQAEIS